MRPDLVTLTVWLTRLIAAFLIISGVLVAGYAPYSDAMGEVLRVTGILFLCAALMFAVGILLQRFRNADRGL